MPKHDNSLAAIVRRERQARAWTQGRLALASGLNLRTVQRVENGSGASAETIQSLAAALNVDLSGLMQDRRAAPGTTTFLGTGAAQALRVGVAMCLPALIFVTLNIAYHEMRLDLVGPIVRSTAWQALVSHPFAPAVLIGGPILSVVLNFPHIVSLRAHHDGNTSVISAVLLNRRLSQWAVVGVAFILIGTMLAYLAAEFLGHLLFPG